MKAFSRDSKEKELHVTPVSTQAEFNGVIYPEGTGTFIALKATSCRQCRLAVRVRLYSLIWPVSASGLTNTSRGSSRFGSNRNVLRILNANDMILLMCPEAHEYYDTLFFSPSLPPPPIYPWRPRDHPPFKPDDEAPANIGLHAYWCVARGYVLIC